VRLKTGGSPFPDRKPEKSVFRLNPTDTDCNKSTFQQVRRHSSVVEQRFCKPLVVGSNPTVGSPSTRMNKGSAKKRAAGSPIFSPNQIASGGGMPGFSGGLF
jgi:hypothetical protein